jgi:hypothetical protein
VLGKAAGKAMTWMLAIYLTCSNVAFLVIMSDQAQPVLIDRTSHLRHIRITFTSH